MRVAATMLIAMAASACAPSPEAEVEGAWVRLAAVPGRPAAGYFGLRGGKVDRTLTGIVTPAARRVELHESMMAANGQGMTMDALDAVPVPAGATVAFAPGGRHAMLFDVDPKVTPGATMPLTLRFSDGTQVKADARVIAAGDPAPK